MAKVTFGPLVSEARNRQGSLVFSRNRYGNYTRDWIATPNPNTSYQAAARDSWRAAGQAWVSALTDTQRDAWRSFGQLIGLRDALGQHYNCTGNTAFQRLRCRLLAAGLTTFDDPPLDQEAGNPGSFTVALDAPGEGDVTLTPASPPQAGECAQIWAAPPQSPAAAYFFRRLRLLQTFAVDDPGPYTITDALADRFPDALPGQLLGLGMRYLRAANAATCGIITQTSFVPTGGFDMLKKATFALTNADLIASSGANIELIPAPGANKILLPLALILNWDFAAGAYANFDPDSTINFQWGGSGIALPCISTNDIYPDDSGPDSLTTAQMSGPDDALGNTPNYLGDPNNRVNQPLNINFPASLGGPITGGNAANFLRGTVLYTILDLTP